MTTVYYDSSHLAMQGGGGGFGGAFNSGPPFGGGGGMFHSQPPMPNNYEDPYAMTRNNPYATPRLMLDSMNPGGSAGATSTSYIQRGISGSVAPSYGGGGGMAPAFNTGMVPAHTPGMSQPHSATTYTGGMPHPQSYSNGMYSDPPQGATRVFSDPSPNPVSNYQRSNFPKGNVTVVAANVAYGPSANNPPASYNSPTFGQQPLQTFVQDRPQLPRAFVQEMPQLPQTFVQERPPQITDVRPWSSQAVPGNTFPAPAFPQSSTPVEPIVIRAPGMAPWQPGGKSVGPFW